MFTKMELLAMRDGLNARRALLLDGRDIPEEYRKAHGQIMRETLAPELAAIESAYRKISAMITAENNYTTVTAADVGSFHADLGVVQAGDIGKRSYPGRGTENDEQRDRRIAKSRQSGKR